MAGSEFHSLGVIGIKELAKALVNFNFVVNEKTFVYISQINSRFPCSDKFNSFKYDNISTEKKRLFNHCSSFSSSNSLSLFLMFKKLTISSNKL